MEPSKPFIERFLQADPIAMGIVLIPLLMVFVIGMIVYVGQGRTNAERRLQDMVNSAENSMQLKKVSGQAANLFAAKAITSEQHDDILNEIRSRREEFDETTDDKSDETEKKLARVFSKAVALSLTTKEAVDRMERHIVTGRFSPEHYLDMWSKRIEDADIVAVVDEEVKKSVQVHRPTSKPSMTSLNRLKKAELVALAKERGVSHSGTKAQIIDAIREEEE